MKEKLIKDDMILPIAVALGFIGPAILAVIVVMFG
jgi:hypothetical protein